MRAGLRCAQGKYLMKKSDEPQYLGADGQLINSGSSNGYTYDFCLEVFDNTTWGGEISVETIVCYEPPVKNFNMSLVVSNNLILLLEYLVVK